VVPVVVSVLVVVVAEVVAVVEGLGKAHGRPLLVWMLVARRRRLVTRTH